MYRGSRVMSTLPLRIKKQKRFCIMTNVEHFRPLCLRELLLASSRNCRYITEYNCNNQSRSRLQIQIAFGTKKN